MNSWRKVGIASRANAPSEESSVGTSRQPSTLRPSASTILSSASHASTASREDCGRKAMPVAYEPSSGRSKSSTARRNPSGT